METKSTTRQSSEKKAYRSYVLARTNSWKDSGDGEKVEKEKGKKMEEGLTIFLLRMKLFFDLLIPQTDIVSQAEFSYLFPSKEYQ